MADDFSEFLSTRGPLPGQPLFGLTVLIVEDSRFACEAMRLLCQRSGARLRRADCLRSARKHLATYRPAVVIVDLGLPDGAGEDLIAELAASPARAPAVIGTSGDPDRAEAALAAGAAAFLPKPIESLAAFQRTVLAALPETLLSTTAVAAATPAAAGADDAIAPDRVALRDDLALAVRLLDDAGPSDKAALGYVSQFLRGVALSAHDEALAKAATGQARLPQLRALVEDRLTGPATSGLV